jgi:hypothetical protein
MRCPQCNKFASYEDPPEVEIEDEQINDDVLQITARLVLKSACCGEELKDNEFQFDLPIDHVCEAPEDGEDQFEIDSTDGEGTSRIEATKEKRLKDGTIKIVKIPYRFQRTFYGLTVTAVVSCNRCKAEIELSETDEIQASGMNELTW